MYSNLILLFATAVLASPGHFKLDIRREYTSTSSLRRRQLDEPLKLAIDGTVSGQPPKSEPDDEPAETLSDDCSGRPFLAVAEAW
jgi:hypothetical protein